MAQPSPIDQVFSYICKFDTKPLMQDAKADVVIVGGGMAGLSAAQAFKKKGCSVILIEKNFCGAGASGKSSGFITPDSEFPLHALVDRYGAEKAKQLWEFVGGGVDLIKNNIESYSLDCDYQKQDTLVAASSLKDFTEQIAVEHAVRKQLGYESTLYSQETVEHVLGSSGYFGAVRYPHTFGINGYYYLQAVKDVLRDEGIEIYEETPALSVESHKVKTPNGMIQAGLVVLCVDRFLPTLHKLTYEVFPVQTFLMISAPLSQSDVQKIFPEERLMVWDTELIYTYYRVTGENRLLLGGSTLAGTYAGREQHENNRAWRKLEKYFKAKFPSVSPHFEYMWPGLIGVSKDIMPIAGRDKEDDSLYYVTAAAGLPWAAALGAYAADALIDGRTDMDAYFNPYRPFRLGHVTQTLLGTRITFALSHLFTVQSI